MTPIYFPHTYIPRSIMAALHTCFSPVVCYQPSSRGIPPAMREWEQQGWLETSFAIAKRGCDHGIKGVSQLDWYARGPRPRGF